MLRRRMQLGSVVAAAVLVVGIAADPAGARTAAPAAANAPKPAVAYDHLDLPQGQWAHVYTDGLAEVHDGARTKIVQLPLLDPDGSTSPLGGLRELPAKGDIIMDLARGAAEPYAAQQVVVVYTSSVTAPASTRLSPKQLHGSTPRYTNSAQLNGLLARLGVDRADRALSGTERARFATMRLSAQRKLGRGLLDFPDAYLLHVTGASVPAAVARLRADANIAYAAPNWTVSTSDVPAVPVSATALRTAAARQRATARPATPDAAGIPDNYVLTSSAQSLLNRPATDVVPAYAELAKQGQLPGQGETITNVSLGDLTDASAAADPSDACNFYASAYGPTTVVQNGQRYIDWPSMPLIPTYTAGSNGALDPTGETCGQDPQLTEVGLDFSMMAPLPHDQQRPDALGSGLTDLLGIAPGANYRLVIPKTPGGAITDVDAAFLAAATQTPRPDVITASLGFGLDSQGFPSRYLEDDPMTEAVLSAIVHGAGIVVSVSANDGLRTATNAPVPPSGGSVNTDLATRSESPTDINDVAYSTAPSRDRDSGAIDVGGSTLNDIFSAPPNNPRNAELQPQQAFPATRYNGGRLYSSGIGARVNVSAPGDNVLSFAHPVGGTATAVQVVNEGGTSASAPEAAAAAAVVLQAARLTKQDKLLKNPLAVRKFLIQTGTQLPDVPQSDQTLHVGPQIDIGNAVSTLFQQAGSTMKPSVARVAVAQRQQASALGGTIHTATDSANISLQDRLVDAWITIAPDWLGIARKGVSYQLAASSGQRATLATTPWARLQPRAILGAAGLSLTSTSTRTVPLVYTASVGNHLLARVGFSLTFGPTDGSRSSVPAPLVDPVVHGPTMRVHYDITGLTGATSPVLVVSHPGRIDTADGLYFSPAYTAPLPAASGTITVPIAALQGAGIYGVGIQDSPGGWTSRNDSAFSFVRVAPTGDARPPVPLVGASSGSLGHYAEFPYDSPFRVSYDVRNIAGANGAIVEISAPAPTAFNNYNPFNNPNGSERDANGHDSGSTVFHAVSGARGTVTLSSLGLDPTMNHVLRILATHDGAVVGEASGVSTVSMDGVRPADGGSVAAGFGVNSHGNDGFLTSNQVTSTGDTLGSVQTFNQQSAAITATDASSSDNYSTLSGGCPGVFADDTGLYDDYDPGTQQDTLRTLKGVATGSHGPAWTPPDSLGGALCAAQNQDTSDTAILGGQGGTNATLDVATSDIANDTFGTPIELAPGLDPSAITIPGGIGQDTGTDTAVVPVIDGAAPNSPGRIVTADLHTGQVSSFPSVTDWFPSGIAVDSTTHTALVTSNDNYGVYDLHNQTATAKSNGGSSYEHPTADPAHRLFVMQEVTSPDFFGSAPNNNAMSSIDVVDEQGNLVQRLEKFNFYNIYLLDMGSFVQLNPSTRTGFTLGPAGAQLYPFSYSARQ